MHPARRRIVWTRHAEQRRDAWREARGITREEVKRTLRGPPQEVRGSAGTRIAQTPHSDGLLRVAYLDRGRQRRVLTLYWTSKVEKYWRKDDADRYDADADILFVEFSNRRPVDAVEEPGGVVVSYDKEQRPVSVEVLHATANHLVHDGRFDVEIG